MNAGRFERVCRSILQIFTGLFGGWVSSADITTFTGMLIVGGTGTAAAIIMNYGPRWLRPVADELATALHNRNHEQ